MQPILKINLATGAQEVFEIPVEWQEKFLGGASLAARLLYDVLTPALDPLSPEAVLLFLTGPLTGTSGPTMGRSVVCGKSPATELWAESNVGGFWGVELRKTGFDGLWVEGKAEEPVYLWINNGEVEIRSAKHFWGQDTYEIQESIKKEVGISKARVAGIGIAGESQIPFACILSDHGRVAGRTGLGAVMGSKNLKAVAVHGSHSVPLYDPQAYRKIRTTANKALRNDTLSLTLRELGTAASADYFDYLGSMPKRGFTSGVMEGADRVSGASIAEKYLKGVSACHACVVACGRVVQRRPDFDKQKGPEYETLVGFGPNLWIDDPEFVIRMNDLCDRYGMDTISVSNTISLAFRLFELGIIDEDDTNGLCLEWGDKDTVEQLVNDIAHSHNFGKILSTGSKNLGKRYGAEELAVQVNGLEVAYHDPRGVSGMALVYATSPRGACHNQSDYFFADIGQIEEELGFVFYDRQGGAEKAANVARHQDWRTVFNSIVMCLFGNISAEEILDLIKTGCGYDWAVDELFRVGERGWTIKRAINNKLGLRRENDSLPKTLLEPLPDGGAAGYIIPFDEMLKSYYQARDWDWETGYPSEAKLKELDLKFVLDDLWN
jgi:aldehyde:ferredoxin oxidoreductase